jgi:hypothetical protein
MKKLNIFMIVLLCVGYVFKSPGRERMGVILANHVDSLEKTRQNGTRNYRITFKQELAIGAEEGDSTKILSKPINVVVGSKGDIYVLDMQEKRIKKFDHNGDYLLMIGRPGQGPGEFMMPYVITIDHTDNLYVADYETRRISTFRPDGSFVASFAPVVPGFYCGGLIMSPQGQLIIHSNKDGKIFHIFDSHGNLISSFGEVWEAPADPRIATIPTFNFAFVYLGPDQNIYACPIPKPNEILKYDWTGKLLAKITKRAPEYPPIKWKNNGAFGAIAKGFVVLKDGKMLVCVSTPNLEKSNGKRTGGSMVLDFYDKDGQFLISYVPEFSGKPRCVDKEGKVYFVTDDPFPQVIKYSVLME